ncbi:MAG: mechanosensitive ion channel family protein [Symploca sp. SIO3E6]|nr:mechanosensitive ion channel family protein [Caldora sp. SIO3E6]
MSKFFRSIAIVGSILFVVYFFTFVLLPLWFRRLSSDLLITTLKILRIPLLLLILFIGLKVSLLNLDLLGAEPWIQIALTALIIITVTYVTSQLLTQVIIYYLKIYAEKSEALWDDVLIPILEGVLPALTYIVGGSFLLQSLGINIAGLWVALGGATFIIGFAFKDALANLLSGLVLLIDTPFQFGDIIALSDGKKLAIVKKIGLRVTHLYIVNEHNDMYLPNAAFEKQAIVNLTRPTPHYYDYLEIPTLSTAEASQAAQIMENIVLAHPDITGNIDKKLELLEQFYGCSTSEFMDEQKKIAARNKLIAEQQLNNKLQEIENAFEALSDKISDFEDQGLDKNEIMIITNDYLKICQIIGLVENIAHNSKRKKKSFLEEDNQAGSEEESLIGLVRNWYLAWLTDPCLIKEDHKLLPEEWELKIELLKRKVNQLWKKLNNLSVDETRLDDSFKNIITWIQERFKRSQTDWQEPKIWVQEIKTVPPISDPQKIFIVKFFVDDIKLEHCERGYRVKNELYCEIMWHLRNNYLSR